MSQVVALPEVEGALAKVKEDQKAGLRKARHEINGTPNVAFSETFQIAARQRGRNGEKHREKIHRKSFSEAFTMLCADETPMVRRAAAHKMRDFVSVCAKQELAKPCFVACYDKTLFC